VSGEFITIAKVAKTQGRHGEVAAELFTDFPERFEQRRDLLALNDRGERRELHLEDFWPHKGQMVLKFAGVDSINDAELLIGSEIQIPREQRTELEEGAVYVSELLGCTVTVVEEQSSRDIGAVANVDFSAGEAPLLIIRQGSKEYMVPFVERFLLKVDLPGRCIEMSLPEGMLELDAPLSKVERERQAQEAAEGGSSKRRRH
jgi:16S rRNA processing protein RimM